MGTLFGANKQYSNYAYSFLAVYPCVNTGTYTTYGEITLPITWGTNSISWYADNANKQFNGLNTNYCYVIVGC